MNINAVDIVFIVIFLSIILSGYSKGLIRSILSCARTLIGFPLAFYAADKYNGIIYNSFVREIAVKRITDNINSSGDVNSVLSVFEDFADKLPLGIAESINLNFSGRLSGVSLATAIVDNIVEPIAIVIIRIIVFILVLAAFYILVGIVMHLIKATERIRNLPLKRINKILGAVFGVFQAFAVVAVLAAILDFAAGFVLTENQSAILEMINSSALLKFINSVNPLLYLV